MMLAPILHLLTSRRPLAIGGVVIAIVVDAVDGVVRRRLKPHVGKEVRERMLPSVAHTDSSAAVVSVGVVLLVVAAITHVLPSDVLGRVGFSTASTSGPTVAVGGEALQGLFEAKATATCGSPISKAAAYNNDSVAAYASTFIGRDGSVAALFGPMTRGDGEPSKNRANSNRDGCSHG